jgi:predicted O-methyltransferase YrrM
LTRNRCTAVAILALQLVLPGLPAEAEGRPAYRFTTDWFTPNIPNWEEHLGQLRGRPGLAYLEVGPYEGQSFFWVVDNLLTDPGSRATAIDIFAKATSGHYGEDYETTFRANLARSGAAERVTVIKGRSQIELRRLPVESFGLIYIDGSHATRDVLTDLVLSWDLLEQGGFMVLDDYRFGTGKKWPSHLRPQFAVDAFITAYAKELEVVHRAYQVILRKQPDRCLKVHYEGCSYIGDYYYDWRKGQLLAPKSLEPVPLRPEQKQMVEQILRSTVMGHPQPVVLDPKIRNDERFIELNEQLGLGL